MIDKGIPRHGYDIVDVDGNKIGVVTSGTQSPTLQKAIGMGYVPIDDASDGKSIYISVRGKNLEARIVKTPFIKSK